MFGREEMIEMTSCSSPNFPLANEVIAGVSFLVVDFWSLPSTGCLIEQLSEEKYECMVCCDVIRVMAPVWSCQSCFHVFHLNCIKKWARSPASQADGMAAQFALLYSFNTIRPHPQHTVDNTGFPCCTEMVTVALWTVPADSAVSCVKIRLFFQIQLKVGAVQPARMSQWNTQRVTPASVVSK